MKRSFTICATVSALALAGIATTAPASARGGFGPAIAGGVIAGALVAGAASSAYAYDAGPYAYGGYEGGPGYYEGGPGYYAPYGRSFSRTPYGTYGVFDDSQHGGQPSYSRPLGE
jgi:hypothetical protein